VGGKKRRERSVVREGMEVASNREGKAKRGKGLEMEREVGGYGRLEGKREGENVRLPGGGGREGKDRAFWSYKRLTPKNFGSNVSLFREWAARVHELT